MARGSASIGLFVGVAAAVLGLGPIAYAQAEPEQPRRGDGGLHVSGGASVGYVGGGSGSISGNVVGPGGGASSGAAAPKKEVAPAPAEQPSAVAGGQVSDAIPVEAAQTDPASERTADPVIFWFAIVGLIVAGAAVLLAGRRPTAG